MEGGSVLPELKQILGAMIFGANRALRVSEMRRCLTDVAEKIGGETSAFATVKDKDVKAALKDLQKDLDATKCGFHINEVAGGFRFQSDAACGKWLKMLLDKGRPDRLSRPALETLSIIAYRQPVSKSAIEAIRGVDVSHIIKNLMEMQLVKISGRSELPGRPFLYATTHAFLEHFGLKNLRELNDIEPMLAIRKEVERKEKASKKAKAEKEESADQEKLDLDSGPKDLIAEVEAEEAAEKAEEPAEEPQEESKE